MNPSFSFYLINFQENKENFQKSKKLKIKMKKKRRNILRKKKKEIDILQDQFSIVFFHKFSWD